MINKRDFLKLGCGSVLMGASGFASSATINKNNNNLIFVMLRGGVDGLSLLVPYKDNNYFSARNEISFSKNEVEVINENWGINGILKNSFVNFYKNNEAVFIPYAGQEHNSRSHFRAQDVLEYGADGLSKYNSGFLSRLTEVLSERKIEGMSFTENLSPIFQSDKLVTMNLDVKHMLPENFIKMNADYLKNIKDEKLKNVYERILENEQLIKDLSKKHQHTNLKLPNVANFMLSGNYKVGFVELYDWDTHAQQKTRISDLMTKLDVELAELKKAMGKEWKNTMVVVVSEFGRMLKNNGGGTDHGHGNLLSLFGGSLKKSQIIGDYLPLIDSNLHENRDLPVFQQNREVLAHCFAKFFDLNENQIDYIFPNVKKINFNLV